MEDIQAIRKVRNGDVDAFSVLVEKYHRRLLGFVYRIVPDNGAVEDIGQEVFLSAFRSLDNFDERRGVPFSAWLFTIARNRCFSELRKKRGRHGEMQDAEQVADESAAADREVLEKERLAALDAALEQLPEPFKGTMLESLRGASVRDIAGRAGVTEGTVKTRLFRARERLRRLLCMEQGEPT